MPTESKEVLPSAPRPAKFIKSAWIRPEDLGVYDAMGYTTFKLLERGIPSSELLRRVKAYSEQRFAGNLADLLLSLRLLAKHGLSRKDVDWWAVHPGGTVVLNQVAKKLELDKKALRFSYKIFENYGNMSSPSVLFVLRDMLDNGQPQLGQKGMLLAFGAGFSAFAALMDF